MNKKPLNVRGFFYAILKGFKLQAIPEKAEKDISCYKVYFAVTLPKHENHFVSLFRSNSIEIGKRLPTVVMNHTVNYKNDEILIQAGYHSFVELNDALNFLERFNRITRCKHKKVVLECFIPEGAHYFTGAFKWNGIKYPNYCSSDLQTRTIAY